MVHGQYSTGIKMKILIREEFKNDYTTRVAGEKLRKIILTTNEVITLDFEDIKVASASFFDEGIAKLALEGWTIDMLNEKIKFINIFRKDMELLKSVCTERGLKLS